MKSRVPTGIGKLLPPALVATIAIALLFAGLGRFGFWEPLESRTYATAQQLATGQSPPPVDPKNPGSGFLLGAHLAAVGIRLGPPGELAPRVPSALLALVTAAILFLTATTLTNRVIGLLAVSIFVTAPMILFHSRQLTGASPFLFAQTTVFCGLALTVFGNSRASFLGGLVAILVGVVVAAASRGIFEAAGLPAACAFLTLLATGDVAKIFDPQAKISGRIAGAIYGSAAVALLATGAFLFVAFVAQADVPLVTGGLLTKWDTSVNLGTAVRHLAYGWYPWSALLPMVFIMSFRPVFGDRENRLSVFLLMSIIVCVGAHTFLVFLKGQSPLFLALPISLGLAHSISRIEAEKTANGLAALACGAFLVIVLRDFAQDPGSIVSGFASKINTPQDFKPIRAAMVASIPFAVAVVVVFFIGAGGDNASWVRKLRGTLAFPLGGVIFGGYLTMSLVPGLSVHLSSKHIIDAYEKFATGGEALAVLGTNAPPVNATVLSSRKEMLDWLSRSDRVFALVSPESFSKIDGELREKTGQHAFVLDDSSDKYLLLVNKGNPGESNVNPLARYVLSNPPENGPAKKIEVNFDDTLTLLGWEVRSDSGEEGMRGGEKFTLSTLWRCDKKMSRSYKMFVHIDGPGPRINGDHDLVRGTYPTREWEAGDYILDVYEGTVAAFQKSGSYTINIGLFAGDDRMKIIGNPQATKDSVPLGRVTMK